MESPLDISLRSYHDRPTSELDSFSLVSFPYSPPSPREPPVTFAVPQWVGEPPTVFIPPSRSSSSSRSSRSSRSRSRRPVQRFQMLANSSYWLALLIFIPISWIIKYTFTDPQSIKDTLVFVFSFLALIPLGEILGHLVGPVADNGITLVIVIFALVKCDLRIVQTYLVGSIMFNLFLFSGILSPKISRTHTEASIRWRLALQTIGIIAVLVPAIYGSLVNNSQVVAVSDILSISHGVAIILLFMFGFYLSRLYNEWLAGPQYYPVVPIYPRFQPQLFVPPYPGDASMPMTPVIPPVIPPIIPWGPVPGPIIQPFPAGVPVGTPIHVLPSGGHFPSGLPFMPPAGTPFPPIVPSMPSPRAPSPPIIPFISTMPTESTDSSLRIPTPPAEPLPRARPTSPYVPVSGVVPMPSTSNWPPSSIPVISSAPAERRPQVSIPIPRGYRPPQMSTRVVSPEPHVTRLIRRWFGKQSQDRSGGPNPPAVPWMTPYSNNPMPVTVIQPPPIPAPPTLYESTEEESHPSVHIPWIPPERSESRSISRSSRDPVIIRPESRSTRRSRTPPSPGPVRHIIRDKESQNIEQDQPLNKSMLVIVAVLIMLIVVTAKWLVDSIDGFLGNANISTEFVGIILLPLIRIARPVTMALNTPDLTDSSSTTMFDSGIQITVLILPFTVILAWIIDKPLTLMFDSLESVTLFLTAIAANYVVQGNYGGVKLNSLVMLCLYATFALVFWFYPGAPLSGALATCR